MESGIRIGDEVIDEYGIRWAVVREPYMVGTPPQTSFVQLWRGNFMSSTKLENVTRTGRFYPQVSELMDALSEERNTASSECTGAKS